MNKNVNDEKNDVGYGEDRWKIWPWYLESLALALGPKSYIGKF